MKLTRKTGINRVTADTNTTIFMKKYFLFILVALAAVAAFFWFFKDSLSAPKKIMIESSLNEEIAQRQEESVQETEKTQEAPAENEAPQQEEEEIEEIPSQEEKSTEPTKEETKKESATFIKQKLASWGHQSSSSRKIDTIVIHSSYDALGDEPYDLDGLIAEYKQYEVAAHYLIDRKGNVYQLIEDKDIAYHAGISSVPDGRMNVNFFSIGIELMNTKEDEYTSKQYKSLNELLDYLKSKYTIKYTLGHDDVAPGRKTDPWNFDWDQIK